VTSEIAGSQKVRFPVEGMTCASCVNRIERYLRKVDGVQEVNVNLATESATVAFEPAVASFSDLGAAVEAAGYEARLDQAETIGGRIEPRHVEVALSAPRALALDIEGMTCASCVNRIERHLMKVDGIVSANVNLATERATVVARPDVTLDQIIGAIEAAGYDAKFLGDGAQDASAAVAEAPADAHAGAREEIRQPQTSFQARHLADTRRRLIVATVFTSM